MKIALLTANIGDFDNVLPIPKQSRPYDYFLFTEKNLPYPLSTLQPRQQATYLKQQAHRHLPGYDYYIWLDGRIEVTAGDFVEDITSRTTTITVTKHPHRHIVYDEYEFLFALMNAGNKYLHSRYNQAGLEAERLKIRADLPLYACGCFCWRVSHDMKNFMNEWYRRTMEYTGFDQCWFSQVAYERSIDVLPYGWDKIKLNKHK